LRQEILTIPISVIKWNEAEVIITNWAKSRESRYVCICNVHSVIMANNNCEFRKVIHEADMVTPDGMPLVWVLRALGFSNQKRINGPDLLWRLCGILSQKRIKTFFYGGSENTIDNLKKCLQKFFPNLQISGMVSPPYRRLNKAEDDMYINEINNSGTGVLFVSLGCPKQERWMAEHKGRINAVMIGVGAAFDYHAGTLKRAPIWMQNCGLEWFYRFISEPKRLWKRYLVTNSLFIWGALRQLLLRN